MTGGLRTSLAAETSANVGKPRSWAAVAVQSPQRERMLRSSPLAMISRSAVLISDWSAPLPLSTAIP